MTHCRTTNGVIRRAAALAAAAAAAMLGATSVAWALPGTRNLSLLPGAVATASPSSVNAPFDTSPAKAIDGNRDGNYGDGSLFYHNAPDSGNLFYQVDLGTSAYIDRVQLLRRTDAQNNVFNNFELTIYKDDGTGQPGAIAFQGDYLQGARFAPGPWGTTDPGKNAPGGTLGRFVKVTSDSPYWWTFSEFQVIGSTTPLAYTDSNNIAIGKTVTTSSLPGFGALLTSGNDGNINGDFFDVNRPVYHSSNFGVGEYWQVDLGAEKQLDHLQLFARGDNDVTQPDFGTTSQFKVTVYKSDGTTVAGSYIVDNNLLNTLDPGYDHIVNTAGTIGEFIRVETTQSQYLSFSELRAFEGPGSAFPTGDYNQDGVVDTQDYYIWKHSFGTINAAADGSGNNIVDAADYTVWLDHFGAIGSSSGSGGLGAQGVPEPSTFVLMLALAALAPLRKYWSLTKQG